MQTPERLTDYLNSRISDLSVRQKDVAKALNVSTEQVRRYLAGEFIPPDRTLAELCRFLRLDFDLAKSLAESERNLNRLIEKSLKDRRFRNVAAIWALMDDAQRDAVLASTVNIYRNRKAS